MKSKIADRFRIETSPYNKGDFSISKIRAVRKFRTVNTLCNSSNRSKLREYIY